MSARGSGDQLSNLCDILGYRFTQLEILREALTHPGAGPRKGRNYQRLEFLGDRVLGLVVADLLIARFPDDDEGALSRRLVALVRAETLAEIAAEIGLGAFLVLAAGEDAMGARENPSLLADACEAVIGALYLDGGLAAAAAFIEARWGARLDVAVPPRDAKTLLQEWAQGRGLALPKYRTLDRAGPDHAPVFQVEVTVVGMPPAVGAGASKQAAEQAAAAMMLEARRAHPEAHGA